MKKFTVKASALAIAAALPGFALAAVNLDSATPVSVKYASEQTVSGTGSALADTAQELTANATLGASFAAGAQAYVRVDLSGGTFTGAPSYAINDSNGAAIVNVSQGGTAGSSYVIYAVGANPGTDTLLGTNVGTIDTNSVTVTSQAGVTMTYRLFETLTAAANPSSGNTLKTATASYIAFSPAITYASAAQAGAVADVSALGGPYTAFTGAGTVAVLSMIDVDLNAVLLQNGNTAAVANVIANTNAASVSGDFSLAQNDNGTYTGAALNRAYLSSQANCGAVTTAAATLSATTATFTGLTAAALTADLYLCVAAEGTPAIPAASYSGTVDLVPQTGYSIADGAISAADITRNGTVLKAPIMTGQSGQSTYIQLANTSSSAANYSTTCFKPSGASSAGTGGTVGAGNTLKLFYNNLGCASGTNAVTFTLAVPQGSVIGTLVRSNTTSGDSAFDGLVGNQ